MYDGNSTIVVMQQTTQMMMACCNLRLERRRYAVAAKRIGSELDD